MIARQRSSLDRTFQLERQPEEDSAVVAKTATDISAAELQLALSTRELADFVSQNTGERCESLYQGESAMYAASGALQQQDLPVASAHEKTALAHLVSARDRVRQILSNSDSRTCDAFRDFDTKQAQKIRQPEKEQSECDLAKRLEELANRETSVSSMIAGVSASMESDNRDETSDKQSVDEAAQTSPTQQTAQSTAQNTAQSPTQPTAQSLAQQTAPSLAQQTAQSLAQQTAQSLAQQTAQSLAASPSTNDLHDAVGDKDMGASDVPSLLASQAAIEREARAIRQNMDEIQKLTALTRQGMDGAVQLASDVSGELAQGNSQQASQSAEEAATTMQSLSKHVAGLLAGDALTQIAMARGLASSLSLRQKELSAAGETAQLAENGNSPQPDDNAQAQDASTGARLLSRDDRIAYARQAAESARLLADLLAAVGRAEIELSDVTTLRALQGVTREGELEAMVADSQRAKQLLEQDKPGQAGKLSGSVAASLDQLALKLDTLQRAIMTPHIESLVAMEQRVNKLLERLSELRTAQDIDQWHFDAEAMLRELAAQEYGGPLAEDLRKAMRDAGWGDNSRTAKQWQFTGNGYRTPIGYDLALRRISGEVRAKIREILLLDMMSSGEEPTPPNYRAFVDRYFEVLSGQTGAK